MADETTGWTALRELMREQGVNNRELAVAIPISQSYLAQLLKGRKSPRAWVLRALADALEVDVSDLEPLPVVTPYRSDQERQAKRAGAA